MPQALSSDDLQSAILNSDVVGIIQKTVDYALSRDSSDIHIEPHDGAIIIRFRVDGNLTEIIEYPENIHPGVISKLKLMSNLKIDETRIPQDGRVTMNTGGKEVDLRLSTLPTIRGEKAVMRIVDKSKKIPTLVELGLRGRSYDRFMKGIRQPNGIVLTSGPTGSGKTTTMYSAMSVLNAPDVNIVTLEDPVENQMDGLNQSQVRPLIGYTFADGLRTALRQDPDIVMVGEIRDKETIDIAIEASLTGHLVLSTIHTNSAVETITRIINMKIPDFLLAASVNMVIAQRLARKLCPHCKQPAVISPQSFEKIHNAFVGFVPYEELDMNIFKNSTFFKSHPNGCEKCNNIGYSGRIGLFEVLDLNGAIRETILAGEPASVIKQVAIKNGLITLEQDGVIKSLQGETSLDEVYKLVKD